MASLTRWTWVWVNSGRWCWTGRPGVLQFMGSELNWTELWQKRQEYTEELYRKDLHDPDNHDGVITHLEPDILECKVKWTFSSVQSLSRVRLFATPWIAAHQASLSMTISRSSLKLTSIESVMPSSHLILCHPLYLLPPIPPSIRVFSNESTLGIRWPKYWSFSFSIIPSKEHPGLIFFKMDWLNLL